ncbi:uncharacterized protein RHOBADRAFT_55540 [Rhodotorula graminis WP1]|uniref:Uncharacterized protein n=1 Tax=Rhodotorula graminis (strain WP1) TaxID=578459 RepID=A0A0P9EUQ2_RHOGW|nr:uncharacterized protein RHOBADRAFT_55540 [Rhodotorula graminis WP1]KPV72868.1 hypothetical protein RHOBADRAFT_55540 [Rhodotorula graminis WP1]
MKPTSLLPLAILLFPSAALATPPPELQDLLSAASAAHTTLPIPAGLESRMVRRRAAEKKLDDEAERVKERLGGVVILPPGHFNHTVSFNGSKYNGATMDPSTIPQRHRRLKRNFWEKVEGHFGFGPSATASAAATKGTGVVDKGKAQSDDGRHYWYVEDSDDQKHWREKDGKDEKHVDEDEDNKDDGKKAKRDVGDFFDNIASEVNADGATSDGASATSAIASKVSSAASAASSVASSTSSAAAAAATSANSTDAVWYNPTTWDDAITAEYRDTKHKISELSVLSKVGLAVLVLVASVLLFALIYCACKLNARRRRRNAAERAQHNLAAASSQGSSRSASGRATPASGRGQRSFEMGRDTSIPVMSYVGPSSSSASTSSSSSPLDKGKGKAGTKEKKGKGWSLLSRD